MLGKDAGDDRNQKISMAEANGVGLFDLGSELLAGGVQRTRIHIAYEEKMRDCSPALRGALSHQAGDGAELLRWRGRCGGRSALDQSLNVFEQDGAVGAGTAHMYKIDAMLAGEAAS